MTKTTHFVLRGAAAALLALIGVVLAASASTLPRAQAQLPALERPTQVLPPQHIGHWTHYIEINVPFRDANGDGTNDYDPRFTVDVNRHISSTAVGEGACPHDTHPHPRIARSGSGAERVAKSRHSGYDSLCVLAVRFQDSVASGVDGIRLTRTSSREVQTSASRGRSTARATYTDGRSTFHPTLTFTGFTAEHAGQRLTINFTPASGADRACAVHRVHDHETWEIDANGNAVRRARATLIDELPANGGTCSYSMTWPNVAGLVTPSAPPPVSETASAVTGGYFARDGRQWTHEVEIEVPFRDADGDGENDYDPQFAVSSNRFSFDEQQGGGVCPGASDLTPSLSPASTGSQLLTTSDGVPDLAPSCVLQTQFQDTVASGVADITLTRLTDEFVETSSTSPVARAAYADGRTTFEPNLTISGLGVDQAGETFEVIFNVGSDAPHACELHPHDDHETWAVDAGGAVARQSPAAVLIDALPNDEGACSYSVTASHVTGRVAQDHPTVSAAAPDATVVYEHAARTEKVLLDLASVPDASGETFTVRIEPIEGAHDNCDEARDVQLTLDENGNVMELITVTDYPRGHDGPGDRCAYVVTWPQSEDGGSEFAHVGSLTARIDGALLDEAARNDVDLIIGRVYLRAPQTFSTHLHLEVTKPPAADTTFVVRIERNDPTLGGCSPDDDYEITVPAFSEATTELPISLIHNPLDTETVCLYTAMWPANDVSGTNWAEDPHFASERRVELGSGHGSALNRYFPQFDGHIDVRTTTAVAQAAPFEVTISPANDAHARCSAERMVTATVRVGRSMGRATTQGLVERPAGADEDCEYVVSWPDGETSGEVWTHDDSYPTDRWLSAASNTATHRYRVAEDTTFPPVISVEVPQLNDADGDNLFAGTEFTLTFSRAPNSDDGCSAGTPVSVQYVVGADGQVTGDHPSPLVDVPARSNDACVYLFHVDGVISSPAGAPLAWELRVETVTATLRASSPRAQTVYHVGDITFVPDVTIAVPQVSATPDGAETNLFADVTMADGTTGPMTFDVGFAAVAGAEADCTDTGTTTYTYTVNADGTVSGTPPALSDRVVATAGDGTQSQTGERCEYEVTFPQRSSGRDWLFVSPTLSLTDDRTSGADRAAGTTYENVGIASPIDLSVMTPGFTPPPDRAVSVTVSAAQGAAATCFVDDLVPPPARSKSKSATLDAGGATSLTEQFRLTDLPASSTSADARCAYDVVWSVTDEPGDAAESPMFTRTAGDATWSPSGRLGSVGSLSATYAVPVEESFEATLNLVVVPHVPEATMFTVEVNPTSSSPTGCSDETRMLTAPAVDGTNDRTITDTFQLLHTVAGEVQHCSYEVVWPDDEDGAGVLYVPEGGFTPDETLSQSSPTATNRYADTDQEILFDASLVVTTTEAVAADTTFVVSVAAPASSSCTPTADVPVVVLAGESTTTHELSLIRRPAMVHTDCEYTLTWETNEDGGTAWSRDDTFEPDAALSFENSSAAVRYGPNVSTFAPSLEFNLPPVDFDGDGRHDYAGARFAVGFAPTGASTSDTSCSSGRTARYEVDAAGAVVVTEPFELVDEHATSACVYAVEFPSRSTPTATGRFVRLIDDDTDDEDVSGMMNDAQATYREGVTRFTGNLFLGGTHIANPDGTQAEVIPVGTEFSVRVRPASDAPAGCDADPTSSATDVTVVMAKSDPVQQQPFTLLTRATLVGMVDRTTDDEPCVYDVKWPATEVGGTDYVRDITSPFINTLSGGDDADIGAVAWYRAAVSAPTHFDATVEVRLVEAAERDQHFTVGIAAPAVPDDCSRSRDITVTVAAGQTVGTEPVSHLVLRPSGAASDCTYAVSWPMNESDEGAVYVEDDSYSASRVDALSEAEPTATNRYQVDAPPDAPPSTPQPRTPSPIRTPAGGSGGGSRGGSGGTAAGPWQITGTPVPLIVTLTMGEREFAPGAAIEVMLNVTGTCGEDLNVFAGLPAEVGLVFAVSAQSGAVANVLAGSSLRLAAYAERGDETRGCELRVTLLSAPVGCTFEDGTTDAAGRSYIELAGDEDRSNFSLASTLTCG